MSKRFRQAFQMPIEAKQSAAECAKLLRYRRPQHEARVVDRKRRFAGGEGFSIEEGNWLDHALSFPRRAQFVHPGDCAADRRRGRQIQIRAH